MYCAPRKSVVVFTLLIAAAGCSGVDEEASTQTQRRRESEKQISEDLTAQGWELSKSGAMWSGHYTKDDLSVEMLKRLQEFGRFTGLDVSDKDLSKDHIQAISELDSLMQLNLAGTGADDSDLDTLDACPQLVMIDARDTSLTPEKAKSWIQSRKTNNTISIFARNPKVLTGRRE